MPENNLKLREVFVESYRGYEIIRNIAHGLYYGDTDFYRIREGGEYATMMAMASAKACRNVIDTHLGKECKHIDLETVSKKKVI